MDEEKTQKKLYQKGAGLKLPVFVEIQPMPAKLQFKFSPDGKNDQALLGNSHRVDISICKNSNIAISSLKLHIDKIEFSDLTSHLRQVDLSQSTMMESVDMDASHITEEA